MALPRSRTKWLAKFMSYDGQHCFHEGLNGCASLSDYANKIEGCGDSNTGLAFYDYEEYIDPSTKIIVIDSDITKAVNYAKMKHNTDITDMMTKVKNRLDNIDALHIDFNNIDKSLKKMWEYVSDKPYDKERGETLAKINIQVASDYAIDIDAMTEFNEKHSYAIF